MIVFKDIDNIPPYSTFKEKYHEALKNGQKNIEAMSISSFNVDNNEVDSRFVNLKFIDNDNFIFFTNYNSPKSIAFKNHNQISALFYWHSINVQIRIKAFIFKTSKKYNDEYFKERSKEKNALAISSNQSHPISNFNKVKEKYNTVKKNSDLTVCPEYWGGYSFKPYSIEFWEGGSHRLNKRNLFTKKGNEWMHSILEP